MSENSGQNDSEIPLWPRPVVLFLLDGWGVTAATEANAIASAKMPFFSKLLKEYPVALLETGAKSINARYLSLGSGCDLDDENQERALTLTSLVSAAGLKQVKITETERLAALTHFFNGHVENRAPKEDWLIVSSEAGGHVVKPTLALKRIAKKLVEALEQEEICHLIVVSIPTLDLVARGGDLIAAQKAANTLDKSLKKMISNILDKNGLALISAAHGNAEKMRQPGIDVIDTEITANPVPLILVGAEFKSRNIGWADPLNNDLSLLAPIGSLADIAPTILEIMKLAKPVEMSGHSLLENK